ncbi:MAG: hypothetical protein AB3N10_11170 [Allomuricauda sp.]
MSKFNGPLYQYFKGILSYENPDPWGEDIDREVKSPYATELCLECLHPVTPYEYFCPHCNWPTGKYVSQMPYLYIFLEGAFLRSGVDGTVKLTGFKVLGLALFACMA